MPPPTQSDDTDKEKEIIKKLILAAQDEAEETTFSRDDLKTLKKIATVYQGLEYLGKFYDLAIKLLKMLGWVGAIYLAWRTGVPIEWSKLLGGSS